MTVLVVLEGFVILVLSVLVVGLLRSHAEILRSLHDLGAGEGTFSQLLAQRAKKVIAVDNSEKMVEFGTALAKEHGVSNLEYRLGDIQEPPIEEASIDLAFFSQALHHASKPGAAIKAAHTEVTGG